MALLIEVGLEDKAYEYPWELSGGEQQRACIARGLIKDPDIILADEPTGNLDPSTALQIVRLLEKINRKGTAILMASHNYRLIKELGFKELNKSKQKSISTLFNMTYERGEFRGVKTEKILKKGVDKVFVQYVNNIILHK